MFCFIFAKKIALKELIILKKMSLETLEIVWKISKQSYTIVEESRGRHSKNHQRRRQSVGRTITTIAL